MLQPKADWFWFTENQQLMLSMGTQWQCTTAYGAKHTVNLPHTDQLFSLHDTECYLRLAERLEHCRANFSDAQINHILINGTAATLFHKPIAPKSWFFEPVGSCDTAHCLATVSNTFNQGLMLVLVQEDEMSTCMLISESFTLTEQKQLNQFELIKMANNRLTAVLVEGAASQLRA
jgi:cell division protein ZapC